MWIRETSALVAPGQLLTGRKQLSQETGIPEGTVEKILRYLETEQQIEQQTTAKFRVITIKNWGLYPATPDAEQQNNNNVTAEEQQRNTYKKDKKEKNEKKEKTELLCELLSQWIRRSQSDPFWSAKRCRKGGVGRTNGDCSNGSSGSYAGDRPLRGCGAAMNVVWMGPSTACCPHRQDLPTDGGAAGTDTIERRSS
ncbi:MAG TPA: hypothetical protein PKZ07_01850 [Sedimentisphaerales bacterium]|nr:hypothetical protein [Sedimentisphaerales bacterium]